MIDITEDLSRLMKKPMIKAARRWFMEVPEARCVDVPDTPTIYRRLEELRLEREARKRQFTRQ